MFFDDLHDIITGDSTLLLHDDRFAYTTRFSRGRDTVADNAFLSNDPFPSRRRRRRAGRHFGAGAAASGASTSTPPAHHHVFFRQIRGADEARAAAGDPEQPDQKQEAGDAAENDACHGARGGSGVETLVLCGYGDDGAVLSFARGAVGEVREGAGGLRYGISEVSWIEDARARVAGLGGQVLWNYGRHGAHGGVCVLRARVGWCVCCRSGRGASTYDLGPTPATTLHCTFETLRGCCYGVRPSWDTRKLAVSGCGWWGGWWVPCGEQWSWEMDKSSFLLFSSFVLVTMIHLLIVCGMGWDGMGLESWARTSTRQDRTGRSLTWTPAILLLCAKPVARTPAPQNH